MNKGEEQRGKRPVSRAERMRRKRERLKRRRRIAIAILCGMVLLLILIIVGIVALVRHFAGGSDTGDKNQGQASDLTIEQQGEEEQQTETETETEPISITISAAGDCTLGTDEYFDPSTSLNAYYDSNGAAYFFQNVKSIFGADDLTIVNMEGTLTEETSRQDKTYHSDSDGRRCGSGKPCQ